MTPIFAFFALVFSSSFPINLNASATDGEVAARFAPVFYQAIGDKPRGDYITNFDFDGDWRGDNNWKNTDDKKFTLRGFIYFSVCETETHYFIHYAVFHPRDYKGGQTKGRLLSDIIREGVDIASKGEAPTGLLAEATVAHENDMEGALVVVAKSGADLAKARVVFVETLHHNSFTPYTGSAESAIKPGDVFETDGQHVLLYVEPKGHGIEAYTGDEKQKAIKETLVYKFAAKAGDPEKRTADAVDYDLLPISTTLWPKAAAATKSITYGTFYDYGVVTINYLPPGGKAAAKKVALGKRASAFLGTTGGINMARPPWAWFSNGERGDPLGSWFFDPAKIIRRDFAQGESFSTAYVRLPFWAK